MGNRHSKVLLAASLVLAAVAGFALALPRVSPMLLAGLLAVLRAVLGAYLVLVGPGLAITTALLPSRRLGTAEHVLAAAAASIATAAIGGILLDATPWGLQPISWSVLLGGITAIASLGALLRLRSIGMRTGKESLSATVQFVPAPSHVPAARLHLQRLALPLVAAVLLGLAVYVARLPAPAARYQGYTTLWMAPNVAQTATSARVGVQSGEFQEAHYRLEIRVNGEVAGVWPGLALEPNQQWQAQLVLPKAGPAGMEVEALLYRADALRTVYRQVRFHLDERNQ